MVSVIALPLWVSVKVGPDVWLCDTKVSPAGNVSVRDTVWASLGPLLVTEIVYVILVPAVAVAGPVLVTPRSAAATAAVTNVYSATCVPQSKFVPVGKAWNWLADQKLA